MDAIAFIRQQVSLAKSMNKDAAAKRYQLCLSSLSGFVGEDNSIELLRVIQPQWVEAFWDYMLNGKSGRNGNESLAPATAKQRMDTLRNLCRTAVGEGLLPNVTLFPGAGDAISVEIRRVTSRHRKRELQRLYASYGRKAELLATAEAANENVSPAFRSDTRILGLTILSVLLGGMGLKGLFSLEKSDLVDNTLRLPHLGTSVALPPVVVSLIDSVGTKNAQLRNLFLEQHTTDKIEEPFVLWIEIAREAGASPEKLRVIIDHLWQDSDASGDEKYRQTVQDVFDKVAKELGAYCQSWFGIRCKGISGIDLQEELVSDVNCHISPESFYAPQDPVIKERAGKPKKENHYLVDSMLFFKSNFIQAETVNKILLSRRYGFIYGNFSNGRREITAIPESQIQNLRRFLDVKDGLRVSLTQAPDLVGRKVRVVAGLYEGCVGEIKEIRLRADDKEGDAIDCLTVGIQGASLYATPNIRPEYLQYVS